MEKRIVVIRNEQEADWFIARLEIREPHIVEGNEDWRLSASCAGTWEFVMAMARPWMNRTDI